MSKFKRCEIVDCTGIVSKSKPIIVWFRSEDEGFGKFHFVPKSEKCEPAHYIHGTAKHYTRKDLKMKLCKDCYIDFRDGYKRFIKIGGINRQIESFDTDRMIIHTTRKPNCVCDKVCECAP